ncbi:MAG: glycosyltransferase family 61 protein [Spartobacteria bacterium]|nr:glycosyltransferase family 61 protein [Spartobacteria bacterium]
MNANTGLFFSKVSQDPLTFKEDSTVEIVSSEPVLRGPEFQNALSGLDNIPLSAQFRTAVEQDLLQDDHRTLYRLKSPTVFVFTFPHGETRHFVISESGVLLEKDDCWLKYFSFISMHSNGYRFNVSINERHIISSEEDFVWCYDTANFSHFLVDALAPLAFFSKKFPDLKNLPIPEFSRAPSWQDEYLQGFGEKRFYLPPETATGQPSFVVFRPKSLLLPVITSTLSRTLAVRDFIRDRWGKPEPIRRVDRFPIYLTRNDHRAARVRNSKEIQGLVADLGGFTVDPSKLNSQQKLELFNLPGIFIAEGSGTTNFSVFSSEYNRQICLLDSASLLEPSFIRGGWPYYHFSSSKMRFLVGKDSKQLAGSPLSSCIYDFSELKNIIQELGF